MTPQQEPLSIPRRPLDFEDYIDIARRHKTAILGPAFAGLVLSVVVAFLWPDTYVSESVIRVVPPQVPERLVPTNVNLQMSERIAAMAQTILGRNSLTNIIQTHNLYPAERKSRPLEDVIEKMRTKDIRIGEVRTMAAGDGRRIPAFNIAFAYRDRITAQKVCQDLVSRFMEENIRGRASQSLMTTEFLREQHAAAKARLEEMDRKLANFRVSNAGRLPEQVEANLQQHYALENRINTLNSSISRVNQEKIVLESQYRALRDQLQSLAQYRVAQGPGGAVRNPGDSEAQRVEAEIARLESALLELRQRYTDTHPDVQRVKASIRAREVELGRLRKQEAAAADPAAEADSVVTQAAVPLEVRRQMQSLQSQMAAIQGSIDAKELELADYQKQLKEANAGLDRIEKMIASSPLNLSEYLQLQQDREAAAKRYAELSEKMAQSEVATDLENRRQGETLEVLDQPSLPVEPTEPNRWLIVSVGIILGFGAGILLAAMQEFKDTTLKNLKDVRAYTKLTVLGSIPLLENDLVVRRRRRIAWLAWTAACMLGILIMSGSIFYYYSTRI